MRNKYTDIQIETNSQTERKTDVLTRHTRSHTETLFINGSHLPRAHIVHSTPS